LQAIPLLRIEVETDIAHLGRRGPFHVRPPSLARGQEVGQRHRNRLRIRRVEPKVVVGRVGVVQGHRLRARLRRARLRRLVEPVQTRARGVDRDQIRAVGQVCELVFAIVARHRAANDRVPWVDHPIPVQVAVQEHLDFGHQVVRAHLIEPVVVIVRKDHAADAIGRHSLVAEIGRIVAGRPAGQRDGIRVRLAVVVAARRAAGLGKTGKNPCLVRHVHHILARRQPPELVLAVLIRGRAAHQVVGARLDRAVAVHIQP